MTAFLIILAVLVFLFAALLSLSATLTLVYDKGWHTTVQFLFIEKEIELTKILSFLLFPEKKAQEAAEAEAQKKTEKKQKKKEKPTQSAAPEPAQPAPQPQPEQPETELPPPQSDTSEAPPKPQKKNPLKDLWDKEGIVGILSLVSNLLETANSAVSTLIRGLHIYSLYVMILVGGADADLIARSYGTVCKYYYPLKGMILSTMKVDNYDDYIQPDFIADRTETEFQLIGSINVALLLKVALKAGFVFLKNFINNKKGEK